MGASTKTIILGGGCFWCTEAVFLRLKGVVSVTSGYAGGEMEHPTYAAVSSGKTGHAEVIKVEYDPAVLEFTKLLAVFFNAHDPTTPDRQGADVGTQYRSIILFTDADQKQEAERYIAGLNEQKKYPSPIVTRIEKLDRFWPAEEEHRNFYAKNAEAPYSQMVIQPKLEKLQHEYQGILKE